MIAFLILIIPTLIILNRLENSRSRKKVSVDGFKMINGHIVRAEDAGSLRSDQRVQQYTIPSVDQLTLAVFEGKVPTTQLVRSRDTPS